MNGFLAFCRWYAVASLLHEEAEVWHKLSVRRGRGYKPDPRDLMAALRILVVRNTTTLRYTRTSTNMSCSCSRNASKVVHYLIFSWYGHGTTHGIPWHPHGTPWRGIGLHGTPWGMPEHAMGGTMATPAATATALHGNPT